MVSKGLIGAVGGGIAAIVIFLLIASSDFLRPPSEGQQFMMKDVVLNLKSVKVLSADEQNAMIEVAFDAYNPNKSSVVLESVQYRLFANGVRIAVSEIGERAEGFITGTGKTFTMYGEYTMNLRDEVEVKNNDLTSPIWSALQGGDVEWRVTGTFFVTDPVRAGGQELDFDFVA